MKIGYVRSIRKNDSYKMQLRYLKRYQCDTIYIEETFFDYDNSVLKKIVEECNPGDKLIVKSLENLGLTTRKLIDFILILKEKEIDFRVLDSTIDTSVSKHKNIFAYAQDIVESDRKLASEKVMMNPRIDKEKISKIREMKDNGASYDEIEKELNISRKTVARYLKHDKDL